MDDSPDTSAVLRAAAGRESDGRQTTAVVDKASSSTVVFIPPENGKLGHSPLLNSSSRILQAIDGAVISFRDVSYHVQKTVRTGACRCRNEPKRILNNVRSVLVELGPEQR